MSGKQTKLRKEVERLDRELRRLTDLRDWMYLLRGDSELAAAPARQRLAVAEARVSELAAKRATLVSRLTELDILGE